MENDLFPLAIQPLTKKPLGDDGNGSNWNSIEYKDEAEVAATFRGACNMGIRLKDNEVVLDIDAPNIANIYTGHILQKHGINIYQNSIGRTKKPLGGIFLNTDDISSIENGRWKYKGVPLVEILTSGKQKIIPPSVILEDGKEDHFKFNSDANTLTKFQSVPCKQLKEAADMIAAASLFITYATGEGGRDTAFHCLARLLKNSKHGFLTEEYVADYISTIAGLSGFPVKPKWTKAYLGANEIKNFDKQFKEYWPELPDAAVEKIKLFLNLEVVEETSELETDLEYEDFYDEPMSVGDIIEADVQPRDWLIRGLIERGTLTMVSGLGGSAKSSLLMLLGYGATGTGFYLGEMFEFTKPLKVLYGTNEDSRDECMRRFAAIRRGIKEKDTNNNRVDFKQFHIDFVSWVKRPLNFIGLKGNKPTINTKAITYLQDKIIKGGYDLVILDPIVSFHTLNENDNGSMSYFSRQVLIGKIARACNVGVLMAGHSSKGSSNNGNDVEANTAATRGAGAIADSCRAVFRFANMNLDVARMVWGKKAPQEILARRHSYSQLASGKINNARVKDGEWYRKEVITFNGKSDAEIDAILLINDPSILAAAEEAEKAKVRKAREDQQRVMKVLTDYLDIPFEEEEHYIDIMNAARCIEEYDEDFVKEITSDDVGNKTAASDYRVSTVKVANKIVSLFTGAAYRHPIYQEREFLFVNEKRVKGNKTRWIKMQIFADNCPF